MARNAVASTMLGRTLFAAFYGLLACGCAGGARTGAPQLGQAQAVSIAGDATRSIPEREHAALLLDASGRALLRGELLSRVPDSWSEKTEGDLFVLSLVGDGRTADRLMALYPEVPDVAVAGEGMPRVLHTAVSRILNRLGKDAAQIAADSDVYVEDRVNAVRTLGEGSRAELSKMLLERIAAHWDTRTAVEDASVLAEFGGEDAASRLVNMANTLESKGKDAAAVRIAAERIRKRLGLPVEHPFDPDALR